MELINGRTPEEIKSAIRDCENRACKDCPYYADCLAGETRLRITKDALALIERLEAQVPRWISVKERLPEPFVSVQVQMPGEEPHPTVREGYISNEGVWVAGYFRREPDEVTHWAEMLKPPKEGRNDA